MRHPATLKTMPIPAHYYIIIIIKLNIIYGLPGSIKLDRTSVLINNIENYVKMSHTRLLLP